MKKILLTTVLVVAAFTASAQEQDNDYRRLVKNMDRAAAQRDSLAVVISALRERYITSQETEREGIGSRIVALEQEAYAVKQQYDKAVAAVAEYEQKNAVANAQMQTGSGTDKPLPQSATATEKQVTNLVYNEFFARNLSVEDYKTLCSGQTMERNLQPQIEQYIQNYATLSALHNEYMKAETEQAADSLMMRFEQMRNEEESAESVIDGEWARVYDNKIYCYNLLMEKCGRNDMLEYAEQSAVHTSENIEEGSGAYFSDVMARYYYQKRGLLAYETKIAEVLELSKARDSLLAVSAKMQQSDFLLSKIVLQKRYFIEYEPLKVVRPSVYNAKNPIPRTKIYEHGTIYRIRIGIFRMTPNVAAWRGVTPISYSDAYNKGLKAYFAGGFSTEQEATDGVKYLKRLGFRDPAVVMWVDGEYIADPAKWATEHADRYNIEISDVAVLPDAVKAAIVARKSDCTISKAGNIFVVGQFAGRSEADDVVSVITAADDRLTIKVVKCE